MTRGLLLPLFVACASPKPVTPPVAVRADTTPVLTAVSTAPLLPSTIVARLPDREITIAELDRRIDKHLREEIATLDPAERDYRLAEERIKILDEVIDTHLLLSLEPQLKGKVEGLPDEVDRALEAVRTQNRLTEAEFEKALVESGSTIADYREDVRRQLIVNRVVSWLGKGLPGTDAEKRAALVKGLRASTPIVTELTLPPKPARLTVTPSLDAPSLDASRLVSAADLEATLKRKVPEFETNVLDTATASFGSWHFRAKSKPESFDLAVRIWREADPTSRWQELQRDLPGLAPWGALATASFPVTSQTDPIVAAGFLDRTTNSIVLVTCGSSLCTSVADVQAVATLYHQRLDRLK